MFLNRTASRGRIFGHATSKPINAGIGTRDPGMLGSSG